MIDQFFYTICHVRSPFAKLGFSWWTREDLTLWSIPNRTVFNNSIFSDFLASAATTAHIGYLLILIYLFQRLKVFSFTQKITKALVGSLVFVLLASSLLSHSELALSSNLSLPKESFKQPLTLPEHAQFLKPALGKVYSDNLRVIDSDSRSASTKLNVKLESLRALLPEWENTLEGEQFDSAVLPLDSSLAQALLKLKGWQVEQEIGEFVRKTPREAVIERLVLLTPPKLSAIRTSTRVSDSQIR